MDRTDFVPGRDRWLGRAFAWTGVALGLIVFVFFGLVPSLTWGGFAGITLARALIGHPIGGELVARVVVLSGMIASGAFGVVLFLGSGLGLGVALHKMVVARSHHPR
jgi:hypothetical protein